MNKALILHGRHETPQDDWFPWLRAALAAAGYQVWSPDLAQLGISGVHETSRWLLDHYDWCLDERTVLIGHASGAAAVLGLLQALPGSATAKASCLVGWDATEPCSEAFEFAHIAGKSRLVYFIQTDGDPPDSLDCARYLHSRIGGDLIVLRGQGHRSNARSAVPRRFSYLLRLIIGDVLQASDITELYTTLGDLNVTIWLDGGWGVDALLGEQTRLHSDLDIVIQKQDVAVLNALLAARGYWEVLRADTTLYNYMLSDNAARLVDVHVIELDASGNGIYGPVEDGAMYPAAALLGRGRIGGQEVRCIAPEWVVRFHSGYKLRESDYHDVPAVCRKFGLELPEEYTREQR